MADRQPPNPSTSPVRMRAREDAGVDSRLTVREVLARGGAAAIREEMRKRIRASTKASNRSAWLSRPRCERTRKDGTPCKAYANFGKNHCRWHGPGDQHD